MTTNLFVYSSDVTDTPEGKEVIEHMDRLNEAWRLLRLRYPLPENVTWGCDGERITIVPYDGGYYYGKQ